MTTSTALGRPRASDYHRDAVLLRLFVDLGDKCYSLTTHSSFEAFINCTSVGSPGGSAPEESPLPEDVALDGTVTVFDTIHTTDEPTPLVRRATEQGARIATGRTMFLLQAELQFEAWTGVRPAEGLFAGVLESE